MAQQDVSRRATQVQGHETRRKAKTTGKDVTRRTREVNREAEGIHATEAPKHVSGGAKEIQCQATRTKMNPVQEYAPDEYEKHKVKKREPNHKMTAAQRTARNAKARERPQNQPLEE